MSNFNLLLVEDSDTDAHMAIRIFKKELKDAGYERMADGQSVVDFFESASKENMPDMILLDLKIPKINGMEVLKRLKQNPETAHLPVIVYSSSGQVEDMKKAYEYGANSYLVKPTDYKLMKENLGTAFRYWINVNKKIKSDIRE